MGARGMNHLLVVGASAVGGFLLDGAVGINTATDAQVTKFAPTSTMVPKVVTGVELGLGGYLAFKKRRHMVTSIIGGVVLGIGARRVLKQMGVITGYQSMPVLGRRHGVAGYQNTPVLGATGMPAQLSGLPAQLQGYGVNGYVPHGSGGGVLQGFGPDMTDAMEIYRNGSGYMN